MIHLDQYDKFGDYGILFMPLQLKLSTTTPTESTGLFLRLPTFFGVGLRAVKSRQEDEHDFEATKAASTHGSFFD